MREGALEPLRRLVLSELAQPVPEAARVLAAEIRARHRGAVRAVLFYGSCLRSGSDGVLDFYALVDSYRSAHARRWHAALNTLLPPNVYYFEAPLDGRLVRCKYAVLSLDNLVRGTSARTLEPYFWARFAQPCALVDADDEGVRHTVAMSLATAIAAFVSAGIPLLPPRFTARTLWTATLRETYRAELRAERQDVAEHLYADAEARYRTVTQLALPALPFAVGAEGDGANASFTAALSARLRRGARARWRLRRAIGKSRFLLRLLRNGLIFEGGVDYVLWKIQRHSGIETDHTWRQQRHPLLALGTEALRLYRAGAFR